MSERGLVLLDHIPIYVRHMHIYPDCNESGLPVTKGFEIVSVSHLGLIVSF